MQRVRFFGNVTVGDDVSFAELKSRYSAVVLSYGANDDKKFGIPGEDLDGVSLNWGLFSSISPLCVPPPPF